MGEKKVYKTKVESRNRICIPFDCWMDARIVDKLELRYGKEENFWFIGKDLMMNPNGSYRVTLPWAVTGGGEVTLTPMNKYIIIDN